YYARQLQRRLLERSVTVVRNELAILPLRFLEDRKFATVTIGLPAPNTFTDITDKYVIAEHFVASSGSIAELADRLKSFTTIIVGLFADPNNYAPVMEQLRSEEHTSELQSRDNVVCRLRLEKTDFNTVELNMSG